MRFTYTITPRTRISAGSGGDVHQTRSIHRHLPGTVVRGALGAAWWTHPSHRFPGPDGQAAFDAFFGGSLEVHDALPVADGVHADREVGLLPLSLIRQKYAGDPDKVLRTVDGWHDLAAGALAQCPACDAPLPRLAGWDKPLDACGQCGTVFDSARGGWSIPRDWLTASTRTALTQGIAATSMLFTRLAVPRTIRYQGNLVVRDDAPQAVLDWLTASFDISVGGQLSTYGRVRWSVIPRDDPPLPTGDTVVLHTLAPTILVDGWGAPNLDLAGALRAIPNAGDVVRTWTRATQVSGWHGVAGVPKPLEWALETGSTAVLRGWSRPALTKLAEGLGLRRLEGYGAVELVEVADLVTFGRPLPPAVSREALPAREEAPTRPAESVSTPPAATTAPEPVPAPAPAAPQTDDPLAILRDALKERATLNGLLDAARRASRLRATKQPPPVFGMLATRVLDEPWCRALGPGSRDAVKRLLKSPDIDSFVTRLESERR